MGSAGQRITGLLPLPNVRSGYGVEMYMYMNTGPPEADGREREELKNSEEPRTGKGRQ